jgi:hypothetical protein
LASPELFLLLEAKMFERKILTITTDLKTGKEVRALNNSATAPAPIPPQRHQPTTAELGWSKDDIARLARIDRELHGEHVNLVSDPSSESYNPEDEDFDPNWQPEESDADFVQKALARLNAIDLAS